MIKRPDNEQKVTYQVWAQDHDEANEHYDGTTTATFDNEVQASNYWWKLVNETQLEVKLIQITQQTQITYTPEDDPILNEKPPVKRDTPGWEEKVEYVVWCKYGNEEEANVPYSDLAAAQDYWEELVNTPNLPEVKLKRVTTETVMRHTNN